MFFANLHDDIGNDIYEHRFQEPNRLDEVFRNCMLF